MTSTPNRALVRLAGVAAALSLVLAVAGFRQVVPRELALLGLALFVAFLVLIALRRKVLAQREAAERGQMIVILAAKLKDEATPTLERMVRQGGQAGEAAGLILQGRAERQRRNPGSTP
jgi:prepilin signal peptidase PulO-like enzyme (type II secretory pathway)